MRPSLTPTSGGHNINFPLSHVYVMLKNTLFFSRLYGEKKMLFFSIALTYSRYPNENIKDMLYVICYMLYFIYVIFNYILYKMAHHTDNDYIDYMYYLVLLRKWSAYL